MATIELSEETLRRLLKEVLGEALEERRDLLHEVFAEVLEDFALAEAIREGQQTEEVTRDEVFAVLRSES